MLLQVVALARDVGGDLDAGWSGVTRATLRSAEFGFFGVVVYTRVHTPRRCGLPLRAGGLDLGDLVAGGPCGPAAGWLASTGFLCSVVSVF